MPTLTETQKHYWVLLDDIRRQMGAAVNDLYAMQRVMRAFAIRVLELDPNPKAITINTQTLITFPNEKFSSKAAYIAYHRHAGTWADDPILFKALYVLGYQPVMHLVGTDIPPYAAFEQTQSTKPLTIHVANYGAIRGGFHWERVIQTRPLKTEPNPSGGDCGFYTIAQQIQKHLPTIQPTLTATKRIMDAPVSYVNTTTVNTEPKASNTRSLARPVVAPNHNDGVKSAHTQSQTRRQAPVAVSAPTQKVTAPVSRAYNRAVSSPIPQQATVNIQSIAPSSSSTNSVLDAVIKHSIEVQNQIERDGFMAIKDQLTTHRLSTQTLIACYQHLAATVDDTYLTGRLKEITKERGGDEAIAATIQGILPVSDCDETLLRQELIHALAREASLRDSSYAYIGQQIAAQVNAQTRGKIDHEVTTFFRTSLTHQASPAATTSAGEPVVPPAKPIKVSM